MRVTKVYTRQGDHGMTRLVGNQEVDKSSQRIEAYGTVDELNSMIGFVRALLERGESGLSSNDLKWTSSELQTIQNLLFVLGGDLATLVTDRWKDMPLISEDHVQQLEKRLDAMNADLPPLEEFILPGGPAPSAALHAARTICRRAEREVVRLGKIEAINEMAIPFLNRLSDYLFVMARWICRKCGKEEVFWSR